MSAVEVAYTVEGEGPALYMVHGIISPGAGWRRWPEVWRANGSPP